MNHFVQPMPSVLEERALYEKQLILSIRYQLNKDQLILRRTADEMNTYYLGRLNEFNQKSNEYIQNSTCYELIETINEINTEQQQLEGIIQSIDLQLEILYQRKLIKEDHLIRLSIGKKTNINLPYLYFLSETNENVHMSVQPRLSSCQHCPIYTLATYLNQLLRPLFDNFSRSTTFLNGGDFIQKLQYYCIQLDILLPKTYFATFKIHDLYTKISHSALLEALNIFLMNPLVNGQHQKLSSDAIQELTATVLRNNFFSYNGKIYRFIQGGPLNLPLIELLCHIYMHHWQYSLVTHICLKDAFYGRYKDTGFLTWNSPIDQLQTLFNKLEQELDSNLQMTTFISSDVHFLHTAIENRKGSLHTHVHHDSTIQPFLLPYEHSHPRLFHRQWFRAALIRAGQYCSSFEDFEDERLYIELTFLANGYSLDFIKYHIKRFLTRFNPNEQKPMNLNRSTYLSFRNELFRCIDQQKCDLFEEQQLLKNHQLIQLHYLFDWGSRCQFNKKFYQYWSTILEQDPEFKKYRLKIKLNTKHCYSSNTLLARSNNTYL
ncbi:unnamed protein product [Rotaria sordida]|uniref:Helix-turn-helix domain-containing protein n=1 Tax=Rotaria sordida TaxID=392033 RepID=A0A815TB60_9BILA|nr:unnamed protein product [Rotaria sordida]CAF1655039.1 unnamed protein product [Rotaria sordida]